MFHMKRDIGDFDSQSIRGQDEIRVLFSSPRTALAELFRSPLIK